MAFLNHLLVEFVLGSRTRRLAMPLIYQVTGVGPHAGQKIEVPMGFETDFASVPRALWAVFPPDDGDTRRAAVLHDYLYVAPNHLGFTRSQADALFRVALKEDGAGFLKRWAMWSGVRAGGWLYWNS